MMQGQDDDTSEMPTPETPEERRLRYIGLGIALGLSFGAGVGLVIGQFLFENFVFGMPIGIGLGIAVGVTAGLLLSASAARQPEADDPEPPEQH